ncbi:MAG: aminotransferase class V-fold PLP-dependent enzyme, partial [Candidatus Hydrothermarchaeales archaeon]
MKTVYLDFAGASPVDPRVRDGMEPFYSEIYGNPSSMHSFGREAAEALESAREKVACLLSAPKSKNIVFTSGATEATNLAIKGIAGRSSNKKEIIISAIEHISVTNVCRYFQKQGFTIKTVGVDEYGFIDLEELKEAISQDTALV